MAGGTQARKRADQPGTKTVWYLDEIMKAASHHPLGTPWARDMSGASVSFPFPPSRLVSDALCGVTQRLLSSESQGLIQPRMCSERNVGRTNHPRTRNLQQRTPSRSLSIACLRARWAGVATDPFLSDMSLCDHYEMTSPSLDVDSCLAMDKYFLFLMQMIILYFLPASA